MSRRDTPQITFRSSGELDSYLLVSLASGVVSACASNAKPVGVTMYPVTAGDEPIGVRLLNAPGTVEIQAVGQVDVDDDLVPAGAGKVKADPGSGIRTLIGRSLTSVSDGGVVEALPYGYGHNLS